MNTISLDVKSCKLPMCVNIWPVRVYSQFKSTCTNRLHKLLFVYKFDSGSVELRRIDPRWLQRPGRPQATATPRSTPDDCLGSSPKWSFCLVTTKPVMLLFACLPCFTHKFMNYFDEVCLQVWGSAQGPSSLWSHTCRFLNDVFSHSGLAAAATCSFPTNFNSAPKLFRNGEFSALIFVLTEENSRTKRLFFFCQLG